MSVGTWLRDVGGELLSLDGRLVTTFRLLLTRPGALDEAWYQGRRASYVSPNRLYMIAAAFLFLASALVPMQQSPIESFATGMIGATQDEAAAAAVQARGVEAEAKVSRWVTNSLKWMLLFGMVPSLALFTRMMIGGRGEHYAKHLVASLHTHSVLFFWLGVVLLVVSATGDLWFDGLAEWIGLVFVGPGMTVYGVRVFRRICGRGRVRTFFGVVLSYFLYFVVLFAVAVFMASAAYKTSG